MSRTLTSVIAGVPAVGAAGRQIVSTNPARTSEVVAEITLGDAGTVAAVLRRRREARSG